MATKTGEIREILITCIEDVKSGKMDPDSAKAISVLMAQLNQSMQVELNYRLNEVGLSKVKIGSLQVGEEA